MKQYNSSSKHTATLSNRGFYTILSLCGLIIAVSAWVLWSSAKSAPAEEPKTSATTPIIAPTGSIPEPIKDEPVMETENEFETPKAVDAPIDASEPVSDKTDAEPVSAPAPEPAPEPAPTVKVSAPVYVRPVSGKVITPFSGDELLYQPTLRDWRVHTGTDISAEPGETVLAITDGTVQDVFEDDMYGTCVSISHNDNLVTTYRGLEEIRVSAGQAVSAGEAIGSCAKDIDSESALGTHLHIEASKEGALIDVLSLIGGDEEE